MLYKILTDMKGFQGHKYTVGEWQTPVCDPVPCLRGYHVCEKQDILKWVFQGDEIWEVETKGKSVSDYNKIAFENIKITKLVYRIPKNLRKSLEKYFELKGVNVKKFNKYSTKKIEKLRNLSNLEENYCDTLRRIRAVEKRHTIYYGPFNLVGDDFLDLVCSVK